MAVDRVAADLQVLEIGDRAGDLADGGIDAGMIAAAVRIFTAVDIEAVKPCEAQAITIAPAVKIMAANARTRCLSALTRGGQIDAVNAAPSAAGQEPTPGPTRTPAFVLPSATRKSVCNILKPRPEERPQGRVSKDGHGHRRVWPPQALSPRPSFETPAARAPQDEV
jgi:hypothetical protein